MTSSSSSSSSSSSLVTRLTTTTSLLLPLLLFTTVVVVAQQDCQPAAMDATRAYEECYAQVGDGFFANQNKAAVCVRDYGRACVAHDRNNNIFVVDTQQHFWRGYCVSAPCPIGDCTASTHTITDKNGIVTTFVVYNDCTGRLGVARNSYDSVDEYTQIDCCVGTTSDGTDECPCTSAALSPHSLFSGVFMKSSSSSSSS